MKFNEQKGNLFELDKKYTLVHCISEDCAMYAGIAVEFQKRFDLRDKLLRVIDKCDLHYPFSIFFMGKQNVISMVTKKKYCHKPTYESFEKALDKVVQICKENDIKYLGMYKLGCTRNGLQWAIVREMIKDKFKYMDIEI